ncbi:hypothetical protein C8A03DRAFT_39463 [Achaetomium macrosporum]|uniref:Uncharacterized protein n=1 Tax=Achaetomium macrosporum TaxID=79813 RepID=A0AAN7C056_9PEZI|nr:hypothetical protein C8A03DRAFT_39463 [Achaetomium macrosporum]
MATFTGRAGTLIGPLTTTWTMPDSCTVHVLNCATCTEGFRGQQCVMSDGTAQASDHTACWPPATTRVPVPQPPFVGWGFYSPGLACPAGYTTACTAQYGGRAEWDVEFTLVPGETAIGCCPEGFQCTNRNGNTCIATASTGTQISVATGMCSGSGLANVNQATFPDAITVTTTAADATNTAALSGIVQTATRQMVLLAPMFQLNHQPSDLPSATQPPTTSDFPSSTPKPPAASDASFATDPAPAPASASASASASAGDAQGGLPTGATIGVGVGAALGGILLTAVVAWVWFKRWRQRREVATSTTSPGTSDWGSNGNGGAWGKSQPAYVYPAQGWSPSSEMEASPAYKTPPTELAG